MIKVIVKAGTQADRIQRAEAAIKAFNSKIIRSKLMIELNERSFYLKPSLRKR